MAHDKQGRRLAEGDEVLLRATVHRVDDGQELNVSVTLREPIAPQRKLLLRVAGHQLERSGGREKALLPAPEKAILK